MLAQAVGPAVTANGKTLRQMFLESTQLCPNNPALISMYQSATLLSSMSTSDELGYLSWNYQQLDDKAERLASSLFAMGLRSGMRIAVFLPNGAEWTLLFWASVKLKTIFVSLDERAVPREEEVRHFLDVTMPGAIFVSTAANARTLMRNTFLDLEGVAIKVVTEPESAPTVGWLSLADCLAPGNEWKSFISQDPGDHLAGSGLSIISPTNGRHGKLVNEEDNDLNATVYILFTSGTSGLPKACALTNKNIWASCVAANGLHQPSCTSKVTIISPPSHSMGLNLIIQAWVNGVTAIVPSPAFDARLTLQVIEKMKCTHISGT